MRVIIGAFGMALSLASAALAATPDSGPVATVRQFIDAFDKGDIAAAKATHVADVSIIDEMPPHEWHGPSAFDAWLTALGDSSKAAGQTDEKVTLGEATRTQVVGDAAYVIMQAAFTYKQKGSPVEEPAQMAFALRDGPAGWKITGWAWAGQVPRPATR